MKKEFLQAIVLRVGLVVLIVGAGLFAWWLSQSF